MMKESTALIGSHDHLVATLAIPAEPTAGAQLGCVLLSAGVVHRIGPHRINVKLARALASDGIASVRVDVSSVGDSQLPPLETPYDQQAVEDLRAALDHMQQATGIESAAILGICSGAVYGLRLALTDPRVVGLLMIDGYAYATRRTRRERWLQRVRSLDRDALGRSLRTRFGRLGRIGGRLAPARPTDPPTVYPINNPPREELAADLTRLLARGVSIHQIFTGSILQHYNYAGQFADAFSEWPALAAAIRSDYRPDIDHTLTSLVAQSSIIEQVRKWLPTLGSRPAVR